jgi:hypothetical protein
MFDAVAVTSPEQAAARIVDGVKANESRIIVGADAVKLDRMQRLMPIRYWKYVVNRGRKLMQGIAQRSASKSNA